MRKLIQFVNALSRFYQNVKRAKSERQQMACYNQLNQYQKNNPEKADWISRHLLALRWSLRERMGANRVPGSLIVGSWNIRAFDGGRPRRDESFHYIAEIIDKFDICAVQELKPDLAPLRRLMDLLGPDWDFFVSDVTAGHDGNNERIGFLYNTNKVKFRNQIGEVVLPPNSKIAGGRQIARTPFFASFQADWFKFTLCSAHIAFKGKDGISDQELRRLEIGAIASALSKRSKSEDEVYFFLGDMNIDSPEDATMKELIKNGFHVPDFGPTNMTGTKHFDQIAFTGDGIKTNLIDSGSFDWRDAVYKPEEVDHYKPIAEKMRGKPYTNWPSKYSSWTTHEISDHLPIWVEVWTDYSDDYLRRFT